MADRETLYELIAQVQDCGCDVTDVVEMIYVENDVLVDHLIANGVTIQKWIPVTERLPEDYNERVLVKIKDANNIIGHPDMDTDRYAVDQWVRWGHNVTHWMPLPEACYMVEHYGVDFAENQQEKDCAMYKDKTKYVEVIRCKECKWYWKGECKNPYIHMTSPCSMYTYSTDFCSYGERRTDV